ncbi:MAG: tRNA-(ms[2]io[6]A)-hydroxylase [Cyclobacteriaceae bacterium]|nr:tRNA-(ms[2]io[6]A)-hydroxylase [Cyclobacteriaceae bacterium]
MEKHVLGLEMATDPSWVENARTSIRDVLIDHAYCEQKAASSCISLIIQYPDKTELVNQLAPVVAEEWTHFEMVLAKLQARGWVLGPQRKDDYVEKISALIKKGGNRDQQLMERLLLNALIEARSCERFRLLWKEIGDPELSQFYYDLMVSEAGHYKNFLSLAKLYASPELVEKRWREILAGETEIIKNMKPREDRMH